MRRTLITINGANPHLDEGHKAALLGATKQLGIMEAKVDRMLQGGKEVDWARLNRNASIHLDNLEQILTALREQIGA